MMTTGETWRGERVLRVAFVVSILVHLLLGLFAFHAFDGLAKLTRVVEKPKEQEVVTISSAIKLDRRSKPVPVVRPRPQTVPRSRPNPQAPPPAYLAQLPLPKAPKPLQQEPQPKHELTKNEPTPLPRPPTSAPTTSPEKRLALVQRPEAVTRVPHEPARLSRTSSPLLAVESGDRTINHLVRVGIPRELWLRDLVPVNLLSRRRIHHRLPLCFHSATERRWMPTRAKKLVRPRNVVLHTRRAALIGSGATLLSLPVAASQRVHHRPRR
jgi:hypothetical protein